MHRNTSPDPPGFEPAPHNGASTADSLCIPSRLAHRTRTIWQYWHVPTLSGPLATQTPTLPPGSRLPSASPNCCDSRATKVFHPHSVNKRLMAHLESMMAATQCDEIFVGGLTFIGDPLFAVVEVAGLRWPVTVRESALPITGLDQPGEISRWPVSVAPHRNELPGLRIGDQTPDCAVVAVGDPAGQPRGSASRRVVRPPSNGRERRGRPDRRTGRSRRAGCTRSGRRPHRVSAGA
jgi:hypothetical protein